MELVKKAKAEVVEAACVIELPELKVHLGAARRNKLGLHAAGCIHWNQLRMTICLPRGSGPGKAG